MNSPERGSGAGSELRPGPPAGGGAGQKGPWELAVFVGDAVAVHPLPHAGQVSIGRIEGNDIRVDDSTVSRRHALLHLGPPLRIEDLGSANGTFVRDRGEPREDGATHDLRPISRQAVDIALGERVNLGRAMIVVRRASTPALGRPRATLSPHPARGQPDAPPAPVARGAEEGAATAPDEGAVVRDPLVRAIYADAYRAALAPISVLILGETGAGKEVLAQAIHRRSPRAGAPFLALNCAALPESLLEAELFGHERGSFTGAEGARPGLFEAANGGTVFLDEVGELPMSTQVKLLRVLEDRRVFRVGARAPRAIDVRFISATNRDLEAQITEGTFRKDLFFRLNGITLTLPPLRARRAEIAPLAERFVESACQELDRTDRPAISAEALALLERYAFPGNVRELRNIMDRAVVLCDGGVILPEHLPAKLLAGPTASPAPPPSAAIAQGDLPTGPPTLPGVPGGDPMERLRSQIDEIERRRIMEALERCGGNQTQAAELLGISRRTLINRLDEYNVPRPRKKA